MGIHPACPLHRTWMSLDCSGNNLSKASTVLGAFSVSRRSSKENDPTRMISTTQLYVDQLVLLCLSVTFWRCCGTRYGDAMSTLVVQAHPLDDSYNAALLASVRAGLDAAGSSHVLFRLGEGERPTADDLTGVERLVLVYPTWNSGQPAMLLDWLQQMLGAAGFQSVVHVQVVTTHGSSKFVNMMQGAWGRRFLGERIIAACAPGAGFDWHALYKIDRRSFDETTAFLEETKRHFSAVPLPAR